MPSRYRVFSIAAVLVLVADQATKIWARGSLPFGRPVKFLGGFWDWELSFNPGSAFGLFNTVESARIFLSIIAIAACIAILVMLHKTRDDHPWAASAYGLIFAGALGNVIDRLIHGKVTDFVLWHAGEHRWPQFNVADAALVAGIVILVLDIGKKKPKPAAAT
jgi:signal peptidase II